MQDQQLIPLYTPEKTVSETINFCLNLPKIIKHSINSFQYKRQESKRMLHLQYKRIRFHRDTFGLNPKIFNTYDTSHCIVTGDIAAPHHHGVLRCYRCREILPLMNR